nr:MAG TPA: hypothetical protein [Caudoviricetes sp.]
MVLYYLRLDAKACRRNLTLGKKHTRRFHQQSVLLFANFSYPYYLYSYHKVTKEY